MSKIISIIQARIGSQRLPQKVLLNLEGKTVLEHIVERVRRSRLIDEVVVGTTILKEDLRIVNLCSSSGIRVYCGSENDVLDRYYQVARLLDPGHIVRITADCPLIDPGIIDKTIRMHLSKENDYTCASENFPDGEDVEVFTFRALKKAWEEARLTSEREHVTPFIKNKPTLFKLGILACDQDFSKKRWTLDEKSDYEFIKLIYKNLYREDKFFGMEQIIRFLQRHPGYENINAGIMRNEGYAKSLKDDKLIRLS